ncbi:interleukin-6 receptor subunit beta [Pempheris klunzingeri]|uniref:interleukin-6 receptor subunit beta n=1 Tax=Pempheris klunzingeri TaxID=3127111 RepID=UPI0039817CE5
MDIRCPNLHLSAWTVMSLCVFSLDVTVKNSDLKLCKDQRVCVTDLRDCGPRPPSSVQRTLNVSCSYQISHRSMTCEWSQESDGLSESDASLIFSNGGKIITCRGIFNPAAVIHVSARMKDFTTGTEVWSQPHTVVLYDAIKPSRPVLTLSGSTEDSVAVRWRSSGDGSCLLRYRAENTHIWTEALDVIPAHQSQTLTYTIRELQPFTAYRAAVACREGFGLWSDWSADVSTTTQDRVPSRPPEVCYRVEESESGGFLLLHLVFEDLDPGDGGRILGYQVSYEPVKKKQQQEEEEEEEEMGRLIQNVTEGTALLVVEEGNCTVTVAAFNTAGFGPAAHLSVDTQRHGALPSVRHLWVSSSFPETRGLLVQWEDPSAQPGSHYAVQWCSDARPSTSRCTTSFSNSTVIQDVGPDESYLVSVFPVYSRQCGSPQSLPASLQQGAMMEAVGMKVVSVTKTTVTAVWAWQKKKSGPIRVSKYRAMLKETSETLFLWPDQRQHTFLNLKPNTEYSLLLLADNVSTSTVHVRTDFDEVPAVAAVTPLLLLAVTVFITSILSRTVYKSYFFPPISSPRGSTAGQWLMDPNHQKKKHAERNILDLEDFQVTDVLGGKSLITVGVNSRPSSEEDLHEDASLLSTGRLIQQDTAYVSDAPVFTEHPLASPQADYPDYAVNCHHPDRVFPPEESREADGAPLHQTRGRNSWFPPQEEESRRLDLSETSHWREAAVKWDLFTSHCVCEMPCEAQYVMSSSFVVSSDAEAEGGQTRCSYLICETDYVANSFCAADVDRTTDCSADGETSR